MNKKEINQFRTILRKFERLSGRHLKSCCGSLTTAKCHTLLEIQLLGSPTLSELSENLELDISTVSRSVDNLVKEGLISRRVKKDDRRSTILKLTPEGKKICNQINRDADRYLAGVIKSIPAKSKSKTLESFETLVEAFNEYEQKIKKELSCCLSNKK